MKIEDVYKTICIARTSLEYLQVNNFGELISCNDKNHLSYIKSIFIQNSLIYYNICIDLSWQVLWLYYGFSNLSIIHYNKVYLKCTKNCNLESLRLRLSLAKEKKLYDIVERFFNSDLTSEIRETYNYIKHRGTFYFDNLGMNYKTMHMSIDGVSPKMLSREDFDIKEWSKKLYIFDAEFCNHFEDIIKYIMPKDYVNNNYDMINDPINYHYELKEYLSDKDQVMRDENIY